MKKKILRYAGIAVLLLAMIPSCELLEDCGNCSLVTYVDGVEESRTPSLPYCGDSYQEKKNDQLDCVGNICTIWECE